MSAGSINPGRYLAYINGVLVPTVSVTVTSGAFSPVSAEVDLVPHRLLLRLGVEDRVDVAIFYMDVWYGDKPRWCLLFEGEIIGWAYVSGASQRLMRFSVGSKLSVLTQLYMKFMSGDDNQSVAKAKPDRDFPSQLNLKGKYPQTIFRQGVGGKRPISRPFDLVENVLHAVLGEHRSKTTTFGVSKTDLTEELERLRQVWSLQRELSIQQTAQAQVRAVPVPGEDKAANARRVAAAEAAATEAVDSANRARLISDVKDYARMADKAAPDVSSLSDYQLQTRMLTRRAQDQLKSRSSKSKSITHTGYFARRMRLSRFLEHWLAFPYLEGRPGQDDPVNGRLGGGVFPMLRSVKADKLFKALSSYAGAKFGERGSSWALLQGVFQALYYEIVEVMAPPAMTVDAHGLPYGPLYQYDKSPASEDDPSGRDYGQWAAALSKDKKRVGIASFMTKPNARFALTPACNVLFPSMWEHYQLTESYAAHPTRVYYKRTGALKKLKLSGAGYAASATRVGFPAVVDGHVFKASNAATSDTEFLIFPEEYFLGPQVALKDAPLLFTKIQNVANSARFTVDKETLALRRQDSEIHLANPIYADRLSKDIRTSERRLAAKHTTHALYFLLAEQEYYTSKYGAAQGSTSGPFNPYLVPGFPTTVLDTEAVGAHSQAQAVSITHKLSSHEWSTSMQMGYVRDLNETLEGVMSDGAMLDTFPQDPLVEIQDLLQYLPTANTVYSLLFRRSEIPPAVEGSDDDTSVRGVDLAADLGAFTRGNGVFDHRTILQWGNAETGPERLVLTRKLTEAEQKLPAFADTYDPELVPNIHKHAHQQLRPKAEVRSLFEDYDHAMKYVSRPVCTLEEYIDFYAVAGRGKTNLDPIGRGRGVRIGATDEEGAVPTYYRIIRQFVGGPGIEPGSSAKKGLTLTVFGEAGDTGLQVDTVFTDIPAGDEATVSDLPDSRKDWQKLLLDYASVVEGEAVQFNQDSDTLTPPDRDPSGDS